MTKLSFSSKNFLSISNLPSPININLWWNLGSLLGVILTNQFISGLLLTMNYCPSPKLAFISISDMSHNLWMGWMIRFFHATGASFMMLLLYFHIGRNIYYSNFKNFSTGISGLVILLLTMVTAFLGYVLPWGQMSFWGATVITSLASVIPFFGKLVVQWLWGSFAVSSSTLNRFFMLHFLFPFIIFSTMIIHLITLHSHGSSTPLSFKKNIEMIEFHPKFSLKDTTPIWLMFVTLLMVNLFWPFQLMDPENFIIANPLTTPLHIQPEWYFLFSYAILRCVPNKMGGVIALVISILMILVPIFKSPLFLSNHFFSHKKLMFWMLLSSTLILTWIGANPVSEPLITLAKIFSVFYFSLFTLI